MNFDHVPLNEYFDIVNPGVKPFAGVKKYVATGALETGKILSFENVDYKSRPTRANMEAFENDIVLAKMKNTEKIFVISKEDSRNIYSTGFSVLRIKDSNQFDPKFVYYWLRSNNFQNLKNKECTGATQKALNETKLAKFKIPKPPLETQKKIANILEKAEKLIDLREDADDLTDSFSEAIFYKMFGDPSTNSKRWETYTIRQISSKISDGPFGSNLKTEHYTPQGVRVIRLQNIGVGKWIDTDKVYVSEKHYDTIKKHTCEPGDVIVGTIGDPNLRACVLPSEIKIAINKADCIQIKPNRRLINPQYLCSLINQPTFILKASALMHGQTRTRISMSQVATLEIPVPPIETQENYCEVVTKLEVIRKCQNKSKEQLSNLLNDSIQRAFRGELAC